MSSTTLRARLLFVAVFAVLGAGGIAFSGLWRDVIAVDALVQHLAAWRWAAPLAFVVVHVVATVAFVPRFVMGLIAGALFGPWLGAACGLGGVLLGAAAAFSLARFIAPDFAHRRLGPRGAALLQWLERAGWRAVFAARLLAAVPHAMVNYGLGLSRVSLAGFLGGTALGLAPTAIVYAQLGAAGRTALDDPSSWLALALWSGTVAASVLLIACLRRLARGVRASEGA